ncbi:helix-turn-helix transcriptional regulator [Pseudonocardia kongjuensis]|uniref:Helix-turn-helix transcriptional regulator n=1 Tax=Pseudonocardia kongjuensis TaxID=102227 RepID=A0ABP4IY32_9PSEU
MAGSPLGEFLRTRRDGARPGDFGLPLGPRRRAPGLRRSELAALAGISVEYLVRIEQGRDRHPSSAVVHALADALRLDAADREHLRHLTKVTDGSECLAGSPVPRDGVRPGVQRLLDLVEPGVALVTDRLGTVLAHTRAFAALAGASGLLDDPRPSLTRYLLVDPRAREVFPDRDRLADEQIAQVWLGPPPEQLDGFRAGLPAAALAELDDRLARHPRGARGVLRWRHPAGELRLDREILELPADDGLQLTVLLPADDRSDEVLRAVVRERGLRVVT